MNQYPYLYANILLLTITFIVGKIFLNQNQMRLVWLGGLASMPCFIFLIFFEAEYWKPVRIGGWKLGIEDMLISFTVGAMLWLALLLSNNQTVTFGNPDRQTHQRYLILAAFSVGFFLIFIFIGLPKMTSIILTYSVIGLFLFFRQKRIQTFVVRRMWKFPLLYLILVKISFTLWPGFLTQWNLNSFWGQTILGIPLGEWSWALAFGFYWPLFVGCLLDIKVVKQITKETHRGN